jgi:hypothetical protein
MNITQKIMTRQSLALFSSILILLNSLLVACGPNQSLPQLMKSSLAGDVSDDGSGSDDDSGGDEEGPGTVSEPEPSEPSSGGGSGSNDSGKKDVSNGNPSGGGFQRDRSVVKLGEGREDQVFSEPSADSDNKGRDTRQDLSLIHI